MNVAGGGVKVWVKGTLVGKSTGAGEEDAVSLPSFAVHETINMTKIVSEICLILMRELYSICGRKSRLSPEPEMQGIETQRRDGTQHAADVPQ